MIYYKNDTTGRLSQFSEIQISPPPGFSIATQVEIDAWKLLEAKKAKVEELKTLLLDFRAAGFEYVYDSNTWTFNLSAQSATYIKAKNDATWTGPARYKYSDITYIQRDFVDNFGFDGFAEAIEAVEDDLMVRYNNYRKAIGDCTTIAQVNALTFNFVP